MAKNVRTHDLSEPLSGTKTAKVIIESGDDNLTIDSLSASEAILASGTLEYLENQEPPTRSLDANNGEATLTLKASHGKQRWTWLPWAACNGATSWQVHLNPSVIADIHAHSNGGNIQLDLASMQVTQVAVENGGGNIDLTLPEHAENLKVKAATGGGGVSVRVGRLAGSSLIEATSGAGNVVLHLPDSTEACIHAISGMGKVMVDPRFSQVDKTTFQTHGYDPAANRVEIKSETGLGNVIISLDNGGK